MNSSFCPFSLVWFAGATPDKNLLLGDILGNLRATFLQSWVIFAFCCVLGVVGHRIHTKIDEIHELFVLALSLGLVCRATPDWRFSRPSFHASKWAVSTLPPAQNRYMQETFLEELIYARIHVGPVVARVRIQKIFLRNYFWNMYSHIGPCPLYWYSACIRTSLVPIHKNACNLTWWAVLGFQDSMKQQEIRRNTGKKTKKLRKKKPKIQQKQPRFCGGFSGPFFTIKLGIFWDFCQFFCPPIEVTTKKIFLGNSFWCKYMRHMYSHPGEYRKVFLANYLCIGFVPGGKTCTCTPVKGTSLSTACHFFQHGCRRPTSSLFWNYFETHERIRVVFEEIFSTVSVSCSVIKDHGGQKDLVYLWGFLIFSGSSVLKEFHKKTFKFYIRNPWFLQTPLINPLVFTMHPVCTLSNYFSKTTYHSHTLVIKIITCNFFVFGN